MIDDIAELTDSLIFGKRCPPIRQKGIDECIMERKFSKKVKIDEIEMKLIRGKKWGFYKGKSCRF